MQLVNNFNTKKKIVRLKCLYGNIDGKRFVSGKLTGLNLNYPFKLVRHYNIQIDT